MRRSHFALVTPSFGRKSFFSRFRPRRSSPTAIGIPPPFSSLSDLALDYLKEETDTGYYAQLLKRYGALEDDVEEKYMEKVKQLVEGKGYLVCLLFATEELKSMAPSRVVVEYLLNDAEALSNMHLESRKLDFSFGLVNKPIPGTCNRRAMVLSHGCTDLMKNYFKFIRPAQGNLLAQDIYLDGKSLISKEVLYEEVELSKIARAFVENYSCLKEKRVFGKQDTCFLEGVLMKYLNSVRNGTDKIIETAKKNYIPSLNSKIYYNLPFQSTQFDFSLVKSLYVQIPNRITHEKKNVFSFQTMGRLSRMKCWIKIKESDFFERVATGLIVAQPDGPWASAIPYTFSMFAFLGSLELLKQLESLSNHRMRDGKTYNKFLEYNKFFSESLRNPLLAALLNSDDKQLVVAKHIAAKTRWTDKKVKEFENIANQHVVVRKRKKQLKVLFDHIHAVQAQQMKDKKLQGVSKPMKFKGQLLEF